MKNNVQVREIHKCTKNLTRFSWNNNYWLAWISSFFYQWRRKTKRYMYVWKFKYNYDLFLCSVFFFFISTYFFQIFCTVNADPTILHSVVLLGFFLAQDWFWMQIYRLGRTIKSINTCILCLAFAGPNWWQSSCLFQDTP